MQNKSILFSAYAFFPEFGGLEQQIYLLAQEYLKLGYTVDVLTEKTRPDLPSIEIIDGITVYRLPFYQKRSVFSYVSLIIRLSAFIIKNRDKYSFIILRAALTLYPLIFGFWKKIGILKTITWVTADTGGDNDEIIIVKKWPFYSVMISIFSAHDYLNSVSSGNYKHYKMLGFPDNKLTYISNGIDISGFNNYVYPKKVTSFIFLGRLIKEKGIYELLQAFTYFHKKHPQSKLYIGGDGPERTRIVNYISNNNLSESIIYKGVIDQNNKNDFYSLGECLVQPSYSEGFGLVYAEAAVRKRIIISTDVADLKKLYGSQICFCQKRSITSIFRCLEYVYASKKFKYINYADVIHTFDIKRTSAQILKLSEIV